MDVMTYARACLRFAEGSRHWSQLRDGQFYVTDPLGEWIESCDNARDGIDVSWAFHQSPETIARYAAEYLYGFLTAEIQLGIDEGWTLEQFKATWDKFLS